MKVVQPELRTSAEVNGCLLKLKNALLAMYRKIGKRALDIAVAATLGILLIPVVLLVAILVRIKLGSPVLFRQIRPGQHMRAFHLVKFRSMTDERDAAGELLSDADRLTSLGAFLRKTSLDEIPELWNVLVGDISLVGPRPMLFSYFRGNEERYAKRHSVLPGITGWAQVNGRNNLPYRKRFELDEWYADNISLVLDMKILFLTFIQLFKTEEVALWEPEIDDLNLKNRHDSDTPLSDTLPESLPE